MLPSAPNTSPNPPPPTILSRFPRFISHFLGYREGKQTTVPGQPTICLWSFLGAFCGLSVIQAVFGYSAYFVRRGAPLIVPSYVSYLDSLLLTCGTRTDTKDAGSFRRTYLRRYRGTISATPGTAGRAFFWRPQWHHHHQALSSSSHPGSI